jgi:hypothetical protein
MENIMSGTVKKVIDQIIAARANGNPTLVQTTKTKLILKGLNPDRYTHQTEDDSTSIAKVYAIAKEMGIDITGSN